MIGPNMLVEPEKGLDVSLAHIVQELNHLKDGLRLLGVKQCCHCEKYFRSEDGKALFDADQLVCYKCVQDWWQQRVSTLDVERRRAIEYKLLRWLVMHHNAKVVEQSKDLPPADSMDLKIVASCEECRGTGNAIGTSGRCHHCCGRGTVWVVGLRPIAQ
jgi:hypothetical protein